MNHPRPEIVDLVGSPSTARNTSPLRPWNNASNHRKREATIMSPRGNVNHASSYRHNIADPHHFATTSAHEPLKGVVTSKLPNHQFESLSLGSDPREKENVTNGSATFSSTTAAASTTSPQTPKLFWSRKRELALRRRQNVASTSPQLSPQDQKQRAIQRPKRDWYSYCEGDADDDDDDDDGSSSVFSSVADPQEDVAPPVAIAHARLDSSLQCCSCHASHSLYLMYPIIKTLDTWNESSKFLCSLCFDSTNASANVTDEQQTSADQGTSDSTLHAAHSAHKAIDGSPLCERPDEMSVRRSVRRQAQATTHLITETTCDMQACLDLLQAVEDEMEMAAMSLSDDCRTNLQASIRRELNPHADESEDVKFFKKTEATIKEELELHDALWQTHLDLLTDTATVLQEALEAEGDSECDLLLAYYQWRAGHRPPQGEAPPTWKALADESLNQRDMQAGLGPGHFWGASGPTGTESDSAIHEPGDGEEAPTHDHYIEELASIKESQFYKLFLPIRRGLGWNTVHRLDAWYEEAERVAHEEEAHIDCIVRTENSDRDLMQQEQKTGLRTLLVRVEDDTADSKPEASPPKKLNNSGSVPPPQEKKQKTAAPSSLSRRNNRPPATPASTSSGFSIDSEEEYQPTQVQKPKPKPKSPVKFPSPTRKRAKRRCLRCIQFNGPSPTRCRGSKGRWGQKGCEYFAASGKKLKRIG